MIRLADLSRHAVNDGDAALSLLASGERRRTSAPTASNRHSSRSHAVFTFHCTAATIDGDLPRETLAKLHLVDLAGRYILAASVMTYSLRLTYECHHFVERKKLKYPYFFFSCANCIRRALTCVKVAKSAVVFVR